MKWEDLARPKECPHGSTLYRRVAGNAMWIAQEKVDGWRVLVSTTRSGSVSMTTRHGEVLQVPIGMKEKLSHTLPAMTEVDAELERPWKCVHVFDVMTMAGVDMVSRPLSERLIRLGAILDGHEDDEIRKIRSSRDVDAFYHQIISEGGEGVVVKRLCDPYPRGGIVWLKVKPNA